MSAGRPSVGRLGPTVVSTSLRGFTLDGIVELTPIGVAGLGVPLVLHTGPTSSTYGEQGVRLVLPVPNFHAKDRESFRIPDPVKTQGSCSTDLRSNDDGRLGISALWTERFGHDVLCMTTDYRGRGRHLRKHVVSVDSKRDLVMRSSVP